MNNPIPLRKTFQNWSAARWVREAKVKKVENCWELVIVKRSGSFVLSAIKNTLFIHPYGGYPAAKMEIPTESLSKRLDKKLNEIEIRDKEEIAKCKEYETVPPEQ